MIWVQSAASSGFEAVMLTSSHRWSSYSCFIFTRHRPAQTSVSYFWVDLNSCYYLTKYSINVVAVTPLCENLPGPKATKPGDVWVLTLVLFIYFVNWLVWQNIRYEWQIRWGRQHGCWRSFGSCWCVHLVLDDTLTKAETCCKTRCTMHRASWSRIQSLTSPLSLGV